MQFKRILISILAAAAVGLAGLAPTTAYADDDKGKKKGHHKGHWNSASPKKNGRHDNRDWNKYASRFDDDDDDDDDDDRRRVSRRRVVRYDRYGRREYVYVPVRRGRSVESEYRRRQDTKNQWRNIAYASGAIAALGLIKNDRTLFFVGTAGALYSLHRYEQDRKSQNRLNRLRAAYFGREYFIRDGRRYDRRLVTRNGQRYYQFVCR